MRVMRAVLSAWLHDPAHLSPEMALRIETPFGAPMDALMRMQNSYDIARKGRGHSCPAIFAASL